MKDKRKENNIPRGQPIQNRTKQFLSYGIALQKEMNFILRLSKTKISFS